MYFLPSLNKKFHFFYFMRWTSSSVYSLSLPFLLDNLQFSCSVVSDSLRPYDLQHVRPPCQSPTSGIYSNSCSLSCWCHPTISSSVSPSLPAFSLSHHQGLFQWVSSLHQVAKYWSFSFSISPSNEYSGLISFRMDWLDYLAVQVILKSLLQHHSPNVYGSSARRLLYGPTLTSVHDFRKTHTFDYEDLCWQNNVSAF